jgi:hypothetical protein
MKIEFDLTLEQAERLKEQIQIAINAMIKSLIRDYFEKDLAILMPLSKALRIAIKREKQPIDCMRQEVYRDRD